MTHTKRHPEETHSKRHPEETHSKRHSKRHLDRSDGRHHRPSRSGETPVFRPCLFSLLPLLLGRDERGPSALRQKHGKEMRGASAPGRCLFLSLPLPSLVLVLAVAVVLVLAVVVAVRPGLAWGFSPTTDTPPKGGASAPGRCLFLPLSLPLLVLVLAVVCPCPCRCLSLLLFVFAVILSAAKDPGTKPLVPFLPAHPQARQAPPATPCIETTSTHTKN
jgi:hypothetical protein